MFVYSVQNNKGKEKRVLPETKYNLTRVTSTTTLVSIVVNNLIAEIKGESKRRVV